ncbi:AIPR family protein [Teichococcus oryzae]|uniref:AIPR family protein n=1 Tax=Teichococcus oryzae TaxID=1608942 RepID=A0A5B2TGG7_9PROT|nr:AIPR family protein [Pseudoroseomonas oryzae]KAA2213194.1 AIPR family protein [Pseudoroseomonas oryzae]
MFEDQLLAEFLSNLRTETDDRLGEIEPGTPLAEHVALAEVMLGYLEEAGSVASHDLCPHEDASGRSRCRVAAYSLPDESSRLEIFTAYRRPDDREATLPRSETVRIGAAAARFFEHAARGDLTRFAGSALADAAARRIAAELPRIEDVRVHVLTDAVVRGADIPPMEVHGRRVEFEVWDAERLKRAAAEGVTRERIEIDFVEMLGRPLACLEMRPPPREYQTFLAILPGDLVFALYERYGARLFEFNVRSFLQAKGGVNKGIRRTIAEESGRFLAYNNGITATADEIDAGSWHGETVIRRVRGLQIVNGAQTTASIHRAKKVDRMDVSQVAVAMKLTRVEAGRLSEFVPLISRYANTQNVIQVADLSANSDFHIELERLSEQLWCPGERTRWFYERTRGAYQVARARFGSTAAKRREFDAVCPKGNVFSKTDLAKFLMCWWERPQTVSRGAQKNFSIFMSELPDKFQRGWKPDPAFYREAVSLAILFRSAQSAVRAAELGSYGANVVAFMVARLAADFGGQFDLDAVWRAQHASSEIQALFASWARPLHEALLSGAGTRNVTEWCKRDDAWEQVRVVDLPEPSSRLPELFD